MDDPFVKLMQHQVGPSDDPFVKLMIDQVGLSPASAEVYRSAIDPVIEELKRGPLTSTSLAEIIDRVAVSRRTHFRSGYNHLVRMLRSRGLDLPPLPGAHARNSARHEIAQELYELVKVIPIERIPRIKWNAYGRHTHPRYEALSGTEVIHDGTCEQFVKIEVGERLFLWATGVEWIRRGIDLPDTSWESLPLVPRGRLVRIPMSRGEIKRIVDPVIREATRAARE